MVRFHFENDVSLLKCIMFTVSLSLSLSLYIYIYIYIYIYTNTHSCIYMYCFLALVDLMGQETDLQTETVSNIRSVTLFYLVNIWYGKLLLGACIIKLITAVIS
jgi:hypothetical protein